MENDTASSSRDTGHMAITIAAANDIMHVQTRVEFFKYDHHCGVLPNIPPCLLAVAVWFGHSAAAAEWFGRSAETFARETFLFR